MDVMRRWLLLLLGFGLCGVTVELVLLQHYEDPKQFIPFGLIVFTFLVMGWHAATGSAASVRTLQVAMVLLIAGGAVGMAMHYQGNVEFQREVDPTLRGWPLFAKAIHAKAPPALAPGSMAQLGLLGLVYAYRHPALTRAGHNTRRVL
jgi:hypothetical protein